MKKTEVQSIEMERVESAASATSIERQSNTEATSHIVTAMKAVNMATEAVERLSEQRVKMELSNASLAMIIRDLRNIMCCLSAYAQD